MKHPGSLFLNKFTISVLIILRLQARRIYIYIYKVIFSFGLRIFIFQLFIKRQTITKYFLFDLLCLKHHKIIFNHSLILTVMNRSEEEEWRKNAKRTCSQIQYYALFSALMIHSFRPYYGIQFACNRKKQLELCQH